MRRPVAQAGDGDTFQDWFNSVPLVTKVMVVSTLLCGAMLTFKMLNWTSVVLIWEPVIELFQAWRLFSTFIFAGPFSFPFALHTYMLYQNSRRYEENPFNTGAGGNTADYLWMILLSMAVLWVVSYFFEMPVLSEPILYVILYVWSRRDPETIVNIFGLKFKALYLPWAYVALKMVMGNPITPALVGIGVGHFYYFLVDILPASHGYNVVVTPKFCISLVTYINGMSLPSGTSAPTSAAPAAAAAHQPGARAGVPNAGAGAYTWGRGRTLGTG